MDIQNIENYYQKLIDKFKQDENYELKLEFGKLLMKHINSFTIDERKRYDELKILLKEKENTQQN